MTIDKHLKISELMDVYLELLTTKQILMMQYYYYDNYTLGEIAELENISRNAVHDQLKRTIKKLEDYEQKLQLVEKRKTRQALLDALEHTQDNQKIQSLIVALKKVE